MTGTNLVDWGNIFTKKNYLQHNSLISYAQKKMVSHLIESSRQFWAETDSQWLSQLDNCQWSNLLSKCLELSLDVIFALNSDGLSVIIKELEGCDVCCVVSSISQLCLDPFYRTFDGFAMLVQKEWVALGHPFGLRLHGLSQTGQQTDQISPVFLLFLDCVNQIIRCHPGEFQFSHFYLLALWDLVLTGLTKEFSSNSLKESLNSNCSAWPLDQHYTNSYGALFTDPAYKAKRTISRVVDCRLEKTRCSRILQPPWHVPELELWKECYLRWSPQAQNQRGGTVQEHLRMDTVASEISALVRDRSRLNRICSTGPNSPTFRRRPSTGSSENITSAFPYSKEAVPLPPEYYSLPKEIQQPNTKRPTSFQIATSRYPVFNVCRNSRNSDSAIGGVLQYPVSDTTVTLTPPLRYPVRSAPPPPKQKLKNSENITRVV